MLKITLQRLAIVAILTISSAAYAENFGGSGSSSKNIVENASNSNDFSTFSSALKSSNVASTLQGQGPYTVFAPTNSAFSKLPQGAFENQSSQNKSKLLSNLVIPGKITSGELTKHLKAGGGRVSIRTLEGDDLTFKLVNGKITVSDKKGNVAQIITADIDQSNGIVHVIDTVLMPQ